MARNCVLCQPFAFKAASFVLSTPAGGECPATPKQRKRRRHARPGFSKKCCKAFARIRLLRGIGFRIVCWVRLEGLTLRMF